MNKPNEYSIDFAKRLVEAANCLKVQSNESNETGRTILYISLLAAEVALKSLLEKAGIPAECIKKHSHNITKIVDTVYKCDIRLEIGGRLIRTSGVCINSITLKSNKNITIGKCFEILRNEEQNKLSKYPNEIRYGKNQRHIHPDQVLEMAEAIISFCESNWETISCTEKYLDRESIAEKGIIDEETL